MNPLTSRQHGSSGTPTVSDASEPSLAERARTLMQIGGVSCLSTMSSKWDGYPFGSVMPYALRDSGAPFFLISSMAMHTQNLTANPKATLLLMQDRKDGDVLGAGRVSVMGEVRKVDARNGEELRDPYLTKNPSAEYWIDFDDFSFFEMEVRDVYFVGGFGVMGWVNAREYQTARPDPLCEVADSIIEHLNSDHVDALILLAERSKGLKANDARVTSIDRLGFNLRVTTAEGAGGVRIGYDPPATSPDQVRQRIVELVRIARRES